MRIPKISLLVVINGPVAIAGSIFLLFKNRGTKVPTKPATIMTTTSDTEMANAVKKAPFHNQTTPKGKLPIITH